MSVLQGCLLWLVTALFLQMVVLSSAQDCGGDLSGTDQGTITSPNYPAPYGSSLNCNWIITVSPGKIIMFTFTALEIEDDSDCDFDYIRFRDGDKLTSPEIGIFCGLVAPSPINTTGSAAHVQFLSDESVVEKGFNISYMAIDVDECAFPTTNDCSNNAVCVNTVGSYTCTCNPGYTGDGLTCTDISDVDECASPTTNECSNNAVCVNTVGSYTCTCNSGYTGDGFTCTDISDVDECASPTTNDCSNNAVCVNTVGSYTCTCNTGYTGDGFTCTDISDGDECAFPTTNDCSNNAVCVNTVESYTCTCNPGYIGDGFTCTDVDECASPTTNECSNNAFCINTVGSYTCTCNSGYTGDGFTCTEVNECASPTTNECSNNAVCINTVGSYTCTCNSGYTGDGFTCTEVNECAFPTTNGCSINAVCANTVGSYTCTCNPGYTGDGFTCTDVDECAFPTTNACSINAVCVNTVGSYTCTCNPGYTGDGFTCTDFDECTSIVTMYCSSNAVCQNTMGSYTCTCNPGYIGDGKLDGSDCAACTDGKYGVQCAMTCYCNSSNSATCDPVTGCVCNTGWEGMDCTQDIDECAADTDNCPTESTCVNNDGSFSCVCPPGFIKDDNNECIDIDECSTSSVCSQGCINTVGSYMCSCRPGHTLDKTDNRTCRVCSMGYFGNDCAFLCPCNTTNTLTCSIDTGYCRCIAGWSDNTCNTDINECDTPDVCNDTLKTCSNTGGSFTCSCKTGYTADAQGTCVDADECTLGTDDCVQTCINVPGSFQCSCYPGFIGNGNTCSVCTDGKYGVQCAMTCYCNSSNSGTCDPVTGCVCNTGWEGMNCTQDIDECAADIARCPANSECVNNNGSFTCVCQTGYEKNIDGNCIAIVTTTVPIAQVGELASTIISTIDYALPEMVDLSDPETNKMYTEATQSGIGNYFLAYMGTTSYKRNTITGLRRGSIIATSVIVIQDAEDAKNTYAEAIANLALNESASVTILGETAKTQRLEIDGKEDDLKTLSEVEIKCAVLFSSVGQCQSYGKCNIVNGNAVCNLSQRSDHFALILSLGMGIPCFFAFVITVAIVIIYKTKKKTKKNTVSTARRTDRPVRGTISHGYFTRVFPVTRSADTWNRRSGHVYGQQVYGDAAKTSRIDKRRHKQPEGIETQETGPKMLDNLMDCCGLFGKKHNNPNLEVLGAL